MDFSSLHYKHAPNIKTPIPGPNSQKLLDKQQELESNAISYPKGIPIAIDSAFGATLKDLDGNVFIDFLGGAGTLNVGHCNPVILEAAMTQQQKLIHALDFPTEIKILFMEKLKSLMPGNLKTEAKIHFGGPTGSDAVESAIKLCRNHTNKKQIISFTGSYHGMTTGALSISSNSKIKKNKFTNDDVYFMPYPYCYRCPFGLKQESCKLACAKYIESCLENSHSGLNEPAAAIIEPIQGEGGTVVPPDGYIKEICSIFQKRNIPIIFDEVQTGFYRTGKMFAVQHYDVSPDVIVLSKALGGIGYPISCIVYNKKLDTWDTGSHIGTFRGHQTAMAAGLKSLEFMLDNNFEEHVTELGGYLKERLLIDTKNSDVVGEIRGKGLMIGVEIVKNTITKEPWSEGARKIRETCLQKGLIMEIGGYHSNVIRFLPPLIITKELIDLAIDIFLNTVRALLLCEKKYI